MQRRIISDEESLVEEVGVDEGAQLAQGKLGAVFSGKNGALLLVHDEGQHRVESRAERIGVDRVFYDEKVLIVDLRLSYLFMFLLECSKFFFPSTRM